MSRLITLQVETPFQPEGFFHARRQPWWVAADVCGLLDINNSRQALARLDEDEKGVGTTDTNGGPQSVAIVNESGLNALLFTSRKPEAKRFRKWVTSEVIPTIRKTGSFSMKKPKSRVDLKVKRLEAESELASRYSLVFRLALRIWMRCSADKRPLAPTELRQS